MKTTVRIKASQIHKDWHVLDAEGVSLGRLATQAATLLRGKHKPTFEPHLDGGDFVIIVNAAKVTVSGAKMESKLYYRHSGYPGGLRSRTFEDELSRFPDRVVRQAVWGMLPKNSLGRSMLRHLKVYAGPDHPHQSQVVGSERASAAREEGIAWSAPRLGVLKGNPAAAAGEHDAAVAALLTTEAPEEPSPEADVTAAEDTAPAAEDELTAEDAAGAADDVPDEEATTAEAAVEGETPEDDPSEEDTEE